MSLTDKDRQDMACRSAVKASRKDGNHPAVKIFSYFTPREARQVTQISAGHQGIPVTAGWRNDEVLWILLTRTLLFVDDGSWKSAYPWDISRIVWGDFKGLDHVLYRPAAVHVQDTPLGIMTYETGEASMVIMCAFLTISRLRRPSNA